MLDWIIERFLRREFIPRDVRNSRVGLRMRLAKPVGSFACDVNTMCELWFGSTRESCLASCCSECRGAPWSPPPRPLSNSISSQSHRRLFAMRAAAQHASRRGQLSQCCGWSGVAARRRQQHPLSMSWRASADAREFRPPIGRRVSRVAHATTCEWTKKKELARRSEKCEFFTRTQGVFHRHARTTSLPVRLYCEWSICNQSLAKLCKTLCECVRILCVDIGIEINAPDARNKNSRRAASVINAHTRFCASSGRRDAPGMKT